MMMAPTDDDERYAKVLISTVQDLAQQLGRIRAEIKEDTAQLLRAFREDVHRTTMGIHVRIVSLEDTYETDRSLRLARQGDLDHKLDAIQRNQRWLVRLAVIAGLVGLGVVIGWLVL